MLASPDSRRYHLRLMNEVTQLLNALDQGDPYAAAQLLPLVYDELRKLAAQRMAQEQPGQTLQPTALVHEAYLRQGPAAWSATFFVRPKRRFAGGSSWRVFPSKAVTLTLGVNEFQDHQTSRLVPVLAHLPGAGLYDRRVHLLSVSASPWQYPARVPGVNV